MDGQALSRAAFRAASSSGLISASGSALPQGRGSLRPGSVFPPVSVPFSGLVSLLDPDLSRRLDNDTESHGSRESRGVCGCLRRLPRPGDPHRVPSTPSFLAWARSRSRTRPRRATTETPVDAILAPELRVMASKSLTLPLSGQAEAAPRSRSRAFKKSRFIRAM